jgi:hypothetical protein
LFSKLVGVASALAGALALAFASAHAMAQSPDATKPAVTALVAVNVVPMDRERVLMNQTVLVEGGKIAAMGLGLKVPDGARVIDGHGTAWLSPGLADMHIHSRSGRDMGVFLANGVTTVLHMGGASANFMDQVRPELNAGTRPGPHLYAGLLVDSKPQYGGFQVTTPDEARWTVRLARTNGYDFIKVYNNVQPEVFAALIDEGRKLHVPVVGHGVTSVGVERQLAMGQLMIAHTEEYMYTVFFGPEDPPEVSEPKPGDMQRAIDFTKRAGAYVTADINTYGTIARQWGKPAVVDQFMQMPQVRYLDPDDRLVWVGESYKDRKGSIDARRAMLGRFEKMMADAGVKLVTGTDSPVIPGLVPGFSLHDDLDALEKAGLTRWQILSAATRTPGEMIKGSLPDADTFGVIAPGARADLILSQSNPLDGLATLRKPVGVMARGNWYAAADLQGMLDRLAKQYDQIAVHN